MHDAVFVAHEVQLADGKGHWFGADAEEATDVDDHLCPGARAVEVSRAALDSLRTGRSIPC